MHPDLPTFLASAFAAIDFPAVLSHLNTAGSETARLAATWLGSGWMLLGIPAGLLLLRWLRRRPLILATLLMIAIETAASAAVASSYTAALQRIFAKLKL